MLFVICIVAFFAFKFFGKSLLASLRWAGGVGLLAFALFVGQPVYRMEVLKESPGKAIANSKTVPLGAQFFPFLNGAWLIFGGPGKGTYAGPCVHYSDYQLKLMNLFGVEASAITGYGHSALRYVEKGRTYMTDNGYWYREIREIGNGNWSPEGPEMLYEIKGDPNPLPPYLFPIGLLLLIVLSTLIEISLSPHRTARVPFRSKGMIKIFPQMLECPYKKSGQSVAVSRQAESLLLNLTEIRQLPDAPDLFFHKDIGHFKILP